MTPTSITPEAVFISDVHLGGFKKEVNDALADDFIRLIQHCDRHAISLYLLGDIFDYWMEYPRTIPHIAPGVLEALERYNKNHGPSLYITGNHDNWILGYFADIGFTVTHEFVEKVFGTHSVILLHGDGLTDPDMNFPRPAFHRFLRNPYFVRLFRSFLPAPAGIWLTRMFSLVSKTLSGDDDHDTEPLDTWVRSCLMASKADVIICGHHHVPTFETINNRIYINTGAFYSDKTLAAYTNNTFSLVFWDGQKDAFKLR